MLMAVGHFELSSFEKDNKVYSPALFVLPFQWLSVSKVKVPMLVSLDFVRILKF